MADSVHHRLQERVKELTALHRVARLLQDASQPLDQVVPAVLALVPPAWQYPEVTMAAIAWGHRQWATPGFAPSAWQQEESLAGGGRHPGGRLVVAYGEERHAADEGPFLGEERELIRSLADLLRTFFLHREADAALVASHERLEQQVADRTAALRRLASEVCLAEERERRRIAADLHDHLGQGLALIRLRLQRLRGDAALGGHDGALDDLVTLCDQAVRYTRGLTFELSPPVLYELGLGPALEWLGDDLSLRHDLRVRVRVRGRAPLTDDLKVMLWKSARELLHNVVKHAGARKVEVTLELADDGQGFDPGQARAQAGERFGLFSIEERLHQFGGRMDIATGRGAGTCVDLIAPAGGGP